MRSVARPLAIALLLALSLGNMMPLMGQAGPVQHAKASAPMQPEVEPNGDMGLAQDVSAGHFYRGTVNVLSDPDDWFKLFVPRGKVLNTTVRLDDPNALNADLEVYYDISGRLDSKWSRTDYQYETVGILSVADEYYYIHVFARTGSGTYTFDTDIKEPLELLDGQGTRGAVYSDSYHVMDYYKVWLVDRGKASDMLTADLTKSPIAPAGQAGITLEAQHLYNWSAGIRIYDSSWGNPAEHVQFVASETGWYYLQVLCYMGSGDYNLTVTITQASTDGNDRLQDAGLLYGPGTTVRGSLDQAMDHRDAFAIYLDQGESLSTTLDLSFSYSDPTIFSTTILQPDGLSVGEWTNFEVPMLNTTVVAEIDHAVETGKYYVLVEAKVAVGPNVQETSNATGRGDYALTVMPSGHNSPPRATGVVPKVTTDEDVPADLDLSPLFTDDNIPEGDRLSYWVGKLTVLDGPTVKAPLNITLNGGNGPLAHMVPAANWCGDGIISYEAQDLFGTYVSVSLSFTVSLVEHPPVTKAEPLEFSLGENVEKRVVDLGTVFSDPDIPYGDSLSFRVDDNGNFPAWVDSQNRLVIGPVMGFGQNVPFTVTATDEAGATAKAYVIVHVDKVEHPPTASVSSLLVTMNEGGTARLTTSTLFSDPDPVDAQLSIQWSGNTNVSLLLQDDGVLTFTPGPYWWGTEHVTLKAIDHTGKAAKIDMAIRVDPVGHAPAIIATDPQAGAAPSNLVKLNGTGITVFKVTAIDKDREDAGRLVYSWYIDGMLQPVNMSFLLLNAEGLKDGNHTLVIMVSDSYRLTDSASWSLSVKRPAQPPVLTRPTVRQATTTTVAAFSLWALVLVFAAEPSRYSLFKFLWVPLYTKIRKEEVLDQFVRGRIFGYIEHNPGVTYSQIKRKIGVGNGTLTHHLSMLEKQNYIKAERDGLYKRFYPRDYHIDEDAIELTTLQRDIYFLAKTRPGISQKDLADELNVSERVVSYHIHMMQEARLIRVERTGRRNALFVEEN